MTELRTPVVGVDGPPDVADLAAPTHPSVRELLTELAALEDATRASGPAGAERLAALAREQEIIEELHRRCPQGPPAV